MQSTLLSTILNRMLGYQALASVEEQYLVRFLDEAIRGVRRTTQFPWMLKKGSLKVFDGVLEYPVAADHDEIAYIDNDASEFKERARFWYTSIQQFYEDPNNRNDLAEIWENGTKYIGCRYKNNQQSSVLLNNAETVSQWSVSGDATAVALDTVNYKEGNGSMKVSITNATGTATVTASNNTLSDSNYQKKYFFIWVYLDSAPTSITLYYGNDASNNLSSTVTTQFSGQNFLADGWNLLGMDLNTATTTGTITTTAFDYQAVTFTGAATGTYFIDASYLREWTLLDYWYYSFYNVKSTSSSVPDREYFMDTAEDYSTDSSLVGDSEWIDVVMYDAMLNGVADKENTKVLGFIADKRQTAWTNLQSRYPSMTPIITTLRWRFRERFPRT